MSDRERISRLVGAAISECSSRGLEEVRGLLLRAMRRLNETGDGREKRPPQNPTPSFKGMSREQRDAAIKAIEDMMDGERPKSLRDQTRIDLFG